MLQQASGLTNVTAHEIAVPFGVHGGRVGSMLATDLLTAVKGVGGLVVSQGLASQEQFDETLATAQADAESQQFRCVTPFHIAFGQRTR